MKLRKIKLVNFRNYRRLEIKFGNTLNIILGKNAQGKTNILESIYFLAITKSYKPQLDYSLIKNEEEKLIATGELKIDKVYKSLSIQMDRKIKKVFINDNEVKKISEYIGNLNVVLSSPDDVNIINGSPSDRRTLINLEISQLSQKYLVNLNEYNKILKTRNEYLKQLQTNKINDYQYLEVLTINLIKRAIVISNERNNFIEKINKNIGKIYNDIMGEGNLVLKYENNIDYLKTKEELLNFYKDNISKDVYQGSTIYGPHRDDLIFMINEEDAKYYASQGQRKIAMMSLKLSELIVFEELSCMKPILLIDDLFSEIDSQKRNKIIEYFQDDQQVIITANDLRGVNKKILKNAKVFRVNNAEIKEKVKE